VAPNGKARLTKSDMLAVLLNYEYFSQVIPPPIAGVHRFAFGGEKAHNPPMSPSVHKTNRDIIQYLREKAKAARAAYELAEPSDKGAAFLRFETAMLALDDALIEERPPIPKQEGEEWAGKKAH